MTPLTFLLFNIFSTSHSLTLSTSTSFTFSSFCPPTYFLYHTTRLIFTTGWILIEVSSHNLTTLVEITLSMMYGLIYQSTNFLAGLFLNTKSFVLNITLFSTFHSSIFSICLPLYFLLCFCQCYSCFFLYLILSTNSIAFSIFLFLLKSTSILNFLP